MLKKIRNLVIFYIIKFWYFVFNKTPYQVNVKVGRILGYLFYLFDSRYKYRAYRNIKLVFHNFRSNDIVNLTKRCYLSLGQNFMEFFLLRRIKNLYNKIVIFPQEDKNVLKNLYSKNKGVVIFSAHFGNWEWLGGSLVMEKFPLAVIAREFYIPQINKFIHHVRESVGEKVIGRGEKPSIKELLTAIKNKYMIGVLVDQNIKNVKNIEVPFLGQNSPTPVSFVEMVIKYKIPSVIGLIYRTKMNKYMIKIVSIDESYYEDKLKFVRYINDVISEYILKYPEQWTWMHNRWN